MITFPDSTLVGKTVPKTAFYKNLEVNARMKQRFVDDVASVTWVAKIAPSTLNVADGKTVHEITVYSCCNTKINAVCMSTTRSGTVRSNGSLTLSRHIRQLG